MQYIQDKKIISFELAQIEVLKNFLVDGWNLVNLSVHNKIFVALLEKTNLNSEEFVYIPPRKKINIIA
jgi:hypothetical protein